jgi:ribonuclease P protein component
VAVRCCAHGVQAAASGSRSSPFGADRRLKGRSAFEPLLREGRRRSVSGYTFYVSRRNEGPPRLGILVTRRHAARATERNRIRRCIREAFRLEQQRLGSLDLLVRPPYGARGSAKMLERLREIFRRLEA